MVLVELYLKSFGGEGVNFLTNGKLLTRRKISWLKPAWPKLYFIMSPNEMFYCSPLDFFK